MPQIESFLHTDDRLTEKTTHGEKTKALKKLIFETMNSRVKRRISMDRSWAHMQISINITQNGAHTSEKTNLMPFFMLFCRGDPGHSGRAILLYKP